MWRRRTSRDDAAAAAQRRLAAIAAEFDHGRVPTSGSTPASSSPLRQAPDSSTTGTEGGRHRRGGGAPDWGRRRLTAQHVAIIALAVAALVTAAAWWALRSVPHDDTVPVAATRSMSSSPAPSAGSVSSTTSPDPGTPSVPTPAGGVPVSDQTQQPGLVVDVAGKVRRPGIVELPAGSRVIDALTAAGGPRPGVDTAGLNLARPLVDGEQIVVGLDVPTAPPVGGPPSTAGATAVPASVDINTADQTELETLPGIGPVTAQSILAWRSENGLFASVDQLLDVSGIGEATLADIEPYVHV